MKKLLFVTLFITLCNGVIHSQAITHIQCTNKIILNQSGYPVDTKVDYTKLIWYVNSYKLVNVTSGENFKLKKGTESISGDFVSIQAVSKTTGEWIIKFYWTKSSNEILVFFKSLRGLGYYAYAGYVLVD